MFGIKKYYAKTVFIFGILETLIGFSNAIMPKFNLINLGFENPTDQTITAFRMVGILAIGFGYYYMRFGLLEDKNFAKFSVQVRLALTLVWTVMIALGMLPLPFISLAVYDLVGAIFTHRALNKA